MRVPNNRELNSYFITTHLGSFDWVVTWSVGYEEGQGITIWRIHEREVNYMEFGVLTHHPLDDVLSNLLVYITEGMI